jgi:hypothetical protein
MGAGDLVQPWVQQAQLIGVGTPILYVPQQGSAVALSADGNTALIGGPGSVYDVGATWVFTRTNGVWQQEQVLIGREIGPWIDASGAKGFNPTYWGNQGYAVALSADGNTALVGGPSDNNSDNTNKGTTWMFTRTNGVWRRGSPFFGGDVNNKIRRVGVSVALSSDAKRWFIVAPDSVTGVRTVYGHPGADLGIPNFYSAATCIALSGDGNTVIFGVPGTAVYVYAYDAGQNVWAQQTALTEPGSAAFGSSVALSADGNVAVIGDPSSNNNTGAVLVYIRYPDGSWAVERPLFDPAGVGARQGASVALSADGSMVLSGGPGDSNGTGAAWLFWREPRRVDQQKIVGTGGIGDAQTPIRQGSAVALSGDGRTALIGGPGDNRNSGATWVFAEPPPP